MSVFVAVTEVIVKGARNYERGTEPTFVRVGRFNTNSNSFSDEKDSAGPADKSTWIASWSSGFDERDQPEISARVEIREKKAPKKLLAHCLVDIRQEGSREFPLVNAEGNPTPAVLLVDITSHQVHLDPRNF